LKVKRNPNHPKRGSRITVEPIRSLEAISGIRHLLSANPRDLLLFTIGINSSLRMGDILHLRVEEVRGLERGDSLYICEKRSGKANRLFINRSVQEALNAYLEHTRPRDEDYLFRSRKGVNQPLTIGTVNALVKGWARAVGLCGNFGAHSLRKTFGYIQRVHFGVGMDVLSKKFHHTNSSMTRRYLGILEKNPGEVLMNDI
jgi:integrase